MTLVERFIEISNWPTSRRVAVWCVFLLSVHLLLWLAFNLFFHRLYQIDSGLLNQYLGLWTGYVALCVLLVMPAALAGREARWTAFALGLPYGLLTVGWVYLFGTLSSAQVVMIPLVVFIVAVALDVSAGAWTLVLICVLLIGIGILESSDLVPYAPMFLERTLDAQRDDYWFGFFYAAFLFIILVAFSIPVLLQLARRLQEDRLKQAQMLIRRYIPAQVADAILSGHREIVDVHTRRKLTFFFSDLVSFTDIAEQLEPEDLSKVLNEYFTEMTAIAQRYDGTVDELSGDAILIFFGAPHSTTDKDHAARAVRMAMDMQVSVQVLNARWQTAGIDAVFRVRMGINTGVATIGNFGSEGRTKYAALGRSVNLAARIQTQCEPGRVLLSHATWLLVNGQIPCTPKSEMQLKGINKPVMTYEVADRPETTGVEG